MRKTIVTIILTLLTITAVFADTIKLVSNEDGMQTYEYNVGVYNGKVVTSSTVTLKDMFKAIPYYNKVEDIMITNMYAMTFADMYGWAAFTNDGIHVTIVEKQSNRYYTLYFCNLGE